MGSLYRPKSRDRHGDLRESAVWWVRFRQHGQTMRQSTETTDEQTAHAFLREREGKVVALNIPVSPQGDRLTLADAAAAMIREDYAANGRKSTRDLEFRLAHLLAHLGVTTRLARVTTGTVERYKAARLAERAAPATINRELAVLRRTASLARRQYNLVAPFEERNTRAGFFERDSFETVCAHLRPELEALAKAAYITGWRKSELRSRQWSHVDFAAGWLRLDPGETKNDLGRQFPLIPELRMLLEAQRARAEEIQRKTKRIVPWIFARDNGAPVGDFKKVWATACIKAGFFEVVPFGEPKAGGATHEVRAGHQPQDGQGAGFDVPHSVVLRADNWRKEDD
jgi:integrase